LVAAEESASNALVPINLEPCNEVLTVLVSDPETALKTSKAISEFVGQCGKCGRSVRLCMGIVSPTGAWEAVLCRACAAVTRRSVILGEAPPPMLALRGRCMACQHRATFGPLAGRARHCKRHRLPGEEDTANRRCRAPGCPRQPAYGDPARGVALYCAAHRAANHTNLKRRLCQHPEVLRPGPCSP
jgi:hypothetical protein